MLKIPSLGPKRVQLLYTKMHIKSLQDLEKAAENKKILELRGFGEKTRLAILDGIKKIKNKSVRRIRLNQAEEITENILLHMKRNPLVRQVEVAGSFRRRQETVGDIDILAASANNESVIKHFLKLNDIKEIISEGVTRSTVILKSELQVDLRVVPENSFGAALLYFTGSKAHNIALRTLALKRGLKINEYGIFQNEKKLASETEEDVYKVLMLPFIEPELRENKGEIEAALNKKLPRLLKQEDIQGDLHVHSKATDGIDSIKDMALAAQKLGYLYIALTDHSKSVTVANGLNEKQLLKQIDEINELNSQFKDFKILKSCEVDILEDGRLDLSDEVLAQLDFTVCAVHSRFNLSKEKQTQRILKAMENPYFRILAHPTGRLIQEREPYDIDMEKIISTAARLGRILEINAQPERMDLPDQYCRMAKEKKVKMVISTDAHSKMQLKFMHFGVGQARRGWLEKKDVINTLPLKELINFLS